MQCFLFIYSTGKMKTLIPILSTWFGNIPKPAWCATGRTCWPSGRRDVCRKWVTARCDPVEGRVGGSEVGCTATVQRRDRPRRTQQTERQTDTLLLLLAIDAARRAAPLPRTSALLPQHAMRWRGARIGSCWEGARWAFILEQIRWKKNFILPYIFYTCWVSKLKIKLFYSWDTKKIDKK